MFRVQIIGAGSIGNHFANASRKMGWDVDIFDIDPNALVRMRNRIYPERYGLWDDAIKQYPLSQVQECGPYDLVIVGTPPDCHISEALRAIKKNPKGILLEKPLCDLEGRGLEQLLVEATTRNVRLFVGYDHLVGKAMRFFSSACIESDFGDALTLDVEFREEWSGIFAAHPWLSGVHDSYLGNLNRGGGALGEHSHALSMWVYLAELIGQKLPESVIASMEVVSDDLVNYDRIAMLNLRTSTGFMGRCVQDVVTFPPRKWARVQFQKGSIEWSSDVSNGYDRVVVYNGAQHPEETVFAKTRPDDFINELQHIESALQDRSASPIDINHGVNVMAVIRAAHDSAANGRTISIDYN